MNIPIPNMTSLPETTQKPPATETTLGHKSFNLTALEMVTILTILSLDLRRYGLIACQLQEQLIWLHGVYSMNSLNCLMRHPPISLEPQDLWKEDNEDKNEPLRKTKKMRLTKTNKIEKTTRTRKTAHQSPVSHTTTSRSREPRNTNTKPKPEPPNQRLGTTILDNHRNTIGRGIKIQIESRNTISRIRTIWTEGSAFFAHSVAAWPESSSASSVETCASTC